MKKTLWLVLVLLLVCVFSLSACDNDDTPSNNDNGNNQQTTEENGENNSGGENNNSSTPVGCQHTFGSWNTIKQATCKEEGKLVRTCTKCSEAEESTVSKTDIHTEVIDAAVSATCTVDGKTEGKHCSVCGKTIVAQTTVKASGHSEVVDPVVNATCEIEGKTEGKHCSICGDITIAQISTGYVQHAYKQGFCTVCYTIDAIFMTEEIDNEVARHENEVDEINDFYDSTIASLEQHIASIKDAYSISYVYSDSYCREKITELTEEISKLQRRVASLSGSSNSADVAERRRLESQISNLEIEQEVYYKHMGINSSLSQIELYRNYKIERLNDEEILYQANIERIDKKYECCEAKHKMVILPSVEPSCEEQGLTEGVRCETCDVDLLYQEAVSAAGHICDNETGLCTVCKKNLFEAGLIFELVEDNTAYMITGYTGSNSILKIPEQYNGLPVVKIGDNAFKKCTVLQTVVLTTNIVKIGNNAFYECTNLTSVTNTDNVSQIGEYAFFCCSNLSTIELTNNITAMGKYAFSSCDNLEQITISSNISKIEEGVFDGCWNLKTIFIPNNVKTIEKYAFSNCSGLVTITVSEGVQSIGRFAFCGCNSLNTIIFPDSLTTIEYGAFQDCTTLQSVTMGLGIETVGGYAFGDCPSLSNVYIKNISKWCNVKFEPFSSNPLNCSTLDCENNLYLNGILVTELEIPEGVTRIESFAFERCYNITTVVIRDGVEYIGGYAFRACTALTSVTIPATVTKIDEHAFYFCTKLDTIKFEGTTEEWKKIELGFWWCNNIAATQVICSNGVVNLTK